MFLFVERLLLAAVVGGLVAVSGCDSSSYYDRPDGGYAYDGYRARDRDSSYERGYRDGERANFNNRHDSLDYEQGYQRGKAAARATSKHHQTREVYRDPRDYRPPAGYEAPAGNSPPRGAQPSPGTFGVNDG